jgi:hypothetical protein
MCHFSNRAEEPLTLHGDCDDLLTLTAAPISRQLTPPYSRSMTDEAPPPQPGHELASPAGLRAPWGPEVPVILRIQVSGKVSSGHITARPPRRTTWHWLRRHP